MQNDFEQDSDEGTETVMRSQRGRSPVMEWARTLVLCGLLLAGLLVILPMMPDRDSRGIDSTHPSCCQHRARPAFAAGAAG